MPIPRFRTTVAALAAATVAAAVAPPGAGAHGLGSSFFAQKVVVELDPEWIRLVYTIEVPVSVLQREFVVLARSNRDVPNQELKDRFKREKAEELRAGLELTLNGAHLVLEDDPATAQVTRPNDQFFLLFEYHLRADPGTQLRDRNVLELTNRNYEGRDTLFNETIHAAPEFTDVHTGLEDDRRYFVDKRTQIHWYPSAEHRNLAIRFARRDAVARADARPTPVRGAVASAPGGPEASRLERLLLVDDLSWIEILAAFALALVLGGLHALSPGHGKAVVAAYLAGSRGRVRDAILLGLVVTLTHTWVVIALGAVTLGLSEWLLPEQIVPYLTLGSGALIVAVGCWMLATRVRELRSAAPEPAHGHDHGYGHGHEHGNRRGLIALGISGGMVPCPSALVVLLLAIAFHRVMFGLGLLLAFSVGLASVLIAIGVLVVVLGRTSDGSAPGPWVRGLPVASAVVMIAIGVAMSAKALLDHGFLQ